MNGAYSEFLEATIQHLECLQRDGRRYVEVSRELLDQLAAKPGRAHAPAIVPQSAPRINVATAPRSAPAAPASPVGISGSAPMKPAVSVASPQGLEPKPLSMAELAARATVCVKCPNLAASRRNVVFGVGDIHAALMFIGEAPGAEEDAQGEPFVGKAGQMLTKIIQTMGFEHSSVYIANILKCRPDTPGQTSGNRKPSPDEMQRCLPYLNAQIDLIQPKIIVALGGSAVEGLLGGAPVRITQLRGQFAEFRGIPVMQTYHPSYLLRPNPVNIKRQVWEDMMQVLEKLGLPISEKQRGFFLAKV